MGHEDRGSDPARRIAAHDEYFRGLAAAEPQRASTYLKQVRSKTDAELDVVYPSTVKVGRD